MPAIGGVIPDEAGQVAGPPTAALPMSMPSASYSNAGGTPTAATGIVATPPSSATAAGFHSPLLPGSTPPIGNPPNTLPAAAPLAALNPELINNPKMREVVQAATVDLGAGPDGVPTLLTWKAEEEDAIGGEEDTTRTSSPSAKALDPRGTGTGGGPSGISPGDPDRHTSSDHHGPPKPSGPQQVFVTGTFAKGWNTKIELRRKE